MSGLKVAMSLVTAAALCVTPQDEQRERAGAVQFQIKNVDLLLTRDIILGVRTLRGQLERTNPKVPVTFDDSDSFLVDADSAEVDITPATLTALMNSYVFAYPNAPVKNITMTFSGDRVIQKGTIHKGVDLPFEIVGSISATEDGKVRLHADSIKSGRLPVKGLLHFLGEDLSKLLHENQGRGIEVEHDDIILLTERLTPPPHIHGRVRQVGISDGKLVMVFDSGRHVPVLKPPFATGAYIYHRRRHNPFRKTDDDGCRLGDCGRPARFVQLLPARIPETARCRVLEEYSRERLGRAHV